LLEPIPKMSLLGVTGLAIEEDVTRFRLGVLVSSGERWASEVVAVSASPHSKGAWAAAIIGGGSRFVL